MQLSKLLPTEAVYLDTEKLEGICQRLGYGGAEAAICAAMEDLAELLSQAGRLRSARDFATLAPTARQIEAIAERIGMCGLAHVAGDVLVLSDGLDDAALSATVARMRRLGEQSLLAIWDRQDLTI